MSLDLTRVFGKVNTVKKNLFYGKDSSVKFLNLGGDILLELFENWYLALPTKDDLTPDIEDWNFTVSNIDLGTIIPLVETVEINGEKYQIAQFERPRALTQRWLLKLTSLGEQE